MCAILTFSRDFYQANRQLVLQQIRDDARSNSDGFALLTMGEQSADTCMMRALSIAPIIAQLETQLGANGDAERAWVHLRYATTGFKGINGCHGFAGGKYAVFHNGELSRPESERFDVDSELIAHDLAVLGRDRAINNLCYDTYANVFIVDTDTGTYDVVRRSTGTLFTDNCGNYSTDKFGPIDQPVPIDTYTEYTDPVVIPRFTQRYVSDTVAVYDYEQYEDTYIAPADDLDDTIACLRYVEDIDDFCDLAEYEGWMRTGIPSEVYRHLNVSQAVWARELGLLFDPSDADTVAAINAVVKS